MTSPKDNRSPEEEPEAETVSNETEVQEEYWTEERMRNAQPYPMIRPEPDEDEPKSGNK